ncbi:MAG: secondary thiamine-phosphate synthase enzyme YjbQ [Deltaproteobacteria bacterium]
MKVHQQSIEVTASGSGLFDVTPEVARIVSAAAIRTGTCHVFVQHTSASLVVQENADPAVLRDLARWLAALAPEDADAYEHRQEGPDDMPAHLRASVTRTSETLPVREGGLALGTWQALYVWEHRRARHRRTLVVTVMGV